jgi:hypothetical protein
MKRVILTVFGAAILLYACNNEAKNETTKDSSATTNSAMTDKEEAWVPVDSAKAMQDMMAAGTPGPMHQMIASWNGTWTGETTMWEKPDGEPIKSTGTAVNTTILGGRYQSAKHSGNMMGMPFEGTSTLGYDNVRKVFVSTWVDNWSTAIMYLSGPWDESTKTMTLSGKIADPSRPGKECNIREVFKIVDDNTQLMEMYGPDPATGKEYKMMEIKLTRKK